MREWRSVAGWLWRNVRRVANERESWRAAVAGNAEVGVSSSGGVRMSRGGRGRGREREEGEKEEGNRGQKERGEMPPCNDPPSLPRAVHSPHTHNLSWVGRLRDAYVRNST